MNDEHVELNDEYMAMSKSVIARKSRTRGREGRSSQHKCGFPRIPTKVASWGGVVELEIVSKQAAACLFSCCTLYCTV